MKGIAFLPGILGAAITLGIFVPSQAQVTSDGTTNTTVNTNGNNFNILNGIQRGTNLFHSFGEFSIPTGGSATFENPSAIKNIINRVTGGNISNIDGLIKANGSASVFLINPSGIVFGENASLNIGGSFLGTTAESILFEDGFEFSAVNAQTEPLLTVNVPLGLQMGSNSGTIEVNGSGHNLTFQPTPTVSFPEFTREENPQGLTLKSGNTLALLSTNILLEGGQLKAEEGRIELGSVASGLVTLTPTTSGFALNYQEISDFGNITLSKHSAIDATGAGDGGINFVGKQVSLLDGSVALIQNSVASSSGNITIKASEYLELTGTNPTGTVRSSLNTETIGDGNSGNIAVNAKKLILRDGGQIITRTYSKGAAGDITIVVPEFIEVNGSSSLNPQFFSSLFTLAAPTGLGKAGDLTISTGRLTVLGGGIVTSSSFGPGGGGLLTLNADSVEIIGKDAVFESPSDLNVAAFQTGNAGSMTIDTQQLIVRDGGRVRASTVGEGNAGSITANVSQLVEVSGNDSSIESSVNSNTLLNELLLIQATSKGQAGGLQINTDKLLVQESAKVSVTNIGPGNGGILEVNAGSIFLNTGGSLSASTQLGGGGNIILDLQESLIMRNNSLIDTESLGTGNGGNITINSPVIAGFESSDIIANAFQGNGGNINITTQGIFGLKFRSSLTPDSDITASSQFGVNGTVEINNVGIDPSSGLIELPTELTDPSQKIAKGCSSDNDSSFVATGRGGIPENPNESVDVNPIWSDIRDLWEFRQRNNSTAENPQIPNPPAIVEATGMIRNENGVIEFVASSPTKLKTNQITDCSGKTTQS